MERSLRTVFIENDNVNSFEDMMAGLGREPGEGRLACVYGRAGRGKTRTAIWHHAKTQGSIYLRMLRIWADSPGGLLNALCRELGAHKPPFRKDDRFNYIVARLREASVGASSSPVFLDEIEKLPDSFLEIVRDLTDETGCPFVLIGEEELYYAMRRHRRVWSRTIETLEFEPLTRADIISYAREAGGLRLNAPVADLFHQASGGDFRLVKRDLGAALRIAAGRKADKIDEKIANAAIKAGLRPGPKRQT
jgi:DNA transposition AAA+ family ATPase